MIKSIHNPLKKVKPKVILNIFKIINCNFEINDNFKSLKGRLVHNIFNINLIYIIWLNACCGYRNLNKIIMSRVILMVERAIIMPRRSHP